MAWGAGSVDGFARDSAKFASLGVRALLSFNEPDVSIFNPLGVSYEFALTPAATMGKWRSEHVSKRRRRFASDRLQLDAIIHIPYRHSFSG